MAGFAKKPNVDVLVQNAIEDILNKDRKSYDALSPVEQASVQDALRDMILNGDATSSKLDVLWEMDYIRKPVGVAEFLTNDYYLGGSCKELHDNWMRDLEYVNDPKNQIVQWFFTGGIGIGKTSVGTAALAYKTYLLSCLRSPAKYYGLLGTSSIVFGVYSITKKQVSDTGYSVLRGYIDRSPYFANEYPRNMRKENSLDFLKQNVKITSGSRNLHSIGVDLFSFLMDEANFMHVGTNKETGVVSGQAYELYESVYSRMTSRFLRPGGTLPGIMLLMSSRKHQAAFLEQKLAVMTKGQYRYGMKGHIAPYTYLSDYALWECKHKSQYTPTNFRVEVGDKYARSRILKKEEKPRPAAIVIDVPDTFRHRFDTDIDQAIRDFAGVPTLTVSPLINDVDSIHDAYKDKALVHPFTKQEFVIALNDDARVEDYFLPKLVCRVEANAYVPKLNPRAPRYVHVDIALTGDSLGIAMGHFSGFQKMVREMPDGTTSSIDRAHIIMDFMLRIRPQAGTEIDLTKVMAFINYVHKFYPMRRVTFDGYQSRYMSQLVKKQGIESVVVSLDRDDAAYLAMRSVFSERRISMYEYTPFIDEVLELQRDMQSRKVDHPEKSSNGQKGSKDVADGTCGVVYNIVMDEDTHALPVFEAESRGAIVVPWRGKASDIVATQMSRAPSIVVPGRSGRQDGSKNVLVTLDGNKLDLDELISNAR